MTSEDKNIIELLKSLGYPLSAKRVEVLAMQKQQMENQLRNQRNARKNAKRDFIPHYTK